jgi:Spy/CpxP family protein refolding chaperone
MKAIRIATLAAALCVGMTSVAAAQGTEPQGQGQGRGERMGGMLLKDINLTDAQKAQVKTIRDKYVPNCRSFASLLRQQVVRQTRRPAPR